MSCSSLNNYLLIFKWSRDDTQDVSKHGYIKTIFFAITIVVANSVNMFNANELEENAS